MPTFVLALLVLTVAPYVCLMGVASFRYAMTRRQTSSQPPTDWPDVSVVLDARSGSVRTLLESLFESNFPTDRLEVVCVCNVSTEELPSPTSQVHLHRIEVDEESSSTSPPALQAGIDAAQGKVVLITSTECTVSPDWIRAMVRCCSPDRPVVLGPTVVENNDRFLPRLQALHRFAVLALAAGFGAPEYFSRRKVNLAVRIDEATMSQEVSSSLHWEEFPAETTPGFTIDPSAAVSCAPASSFDDYLQSQVQLLRRGIQESAWGPPAIAIGTWLTHAVVFACCLGAVVLPAWRQPTLLALLTKMGGDAILSVPTVRHHDHHNLLRSFVPSELLLIATIPFAGALLALMGFAPFQLNTSESPRQ